MVVWNNAWNTIKDAFGASSKKEGLKEQCNGIPPLSRVLEEFCATQGWDSKVESVDNGRISRISNVIDIGNQNFRMYLDAHEESRILALFIYAPYSVIDGKFVDACMLFNFINGRYQYHGRLSVDEDDGEIRYKDYIDFDGVEPSIAMVRNMADCGVTLFEKEQEALAAVALTKKTYESLREEYFKKEAANKESETKD
ncbi:MAG: YbjN domain-containing protein [Chlorobiaceae bacterium]|nr:YbjN domain-containing protein [Chlorobiaceae bacterium]